MRVFITKGTSFNGKANGAGDKAFTPTMIKIAKEKGFSAFVGGTYTWAVTNVQDTTAAYVAAIEQGRAASAYHVAAENLTTQSIAEEIGKYIGVSGRSISADESPTHFGFLLALILQRDTPISSEETEGGAALAAARRDLIRDITAGR